MRRTTLFAVAAAVIATFAGSAQASKGVATVSSGVITSERCCDSSYVAIDAERMSGPITITVDVSDDGRTATITSPSIVLVSTGCDVGAGGGTCSAPASAPFQSVSITGDDMGNRLEVRGPETVLDSGGYPATVWASLTGGALRDVLIESVGGGALSGREGDDTLTGGPGSDSFSGGAGADDFDGGGGSDSVSYEGSPGVRATLDGVADDGAPGEGDNIRANVESVLSGGHPGGSSGCVSSIIPCAPPSAWTDPPGQDLMIGTAADNTFSSDNGPAYLSGLDGDDSFFVYANAEVRGGNGNDRLHASAYRTPNPAVRLFGGDGDDRLWTWDDVGNDTLTCGPGIDRVQADHDDVIAADCEEVQLL